MRQRVGTNLLQKLLRCRNWAALSRANAVFSEASCVCRKLSWLSFGISVCMLGIGFVPVCGCSHPADRGAGTHSALHLVRSRRIAFPLSNRHLCLHTLRYLNKQTHTYIRTHAPACTHASTQTHSQTRTYAHRHLSWPDWQRPLAGVSAGQP